MWFLLWLVVSVFILGVFTWSLQILMQQKKAWQAYAKKAALEYTPGKFMDSPTLQGVVAGYRTAIYSQRQPTPDGRGQRYVTVLEFELGEGLPTGGLVAAMSFAPMVAGLNFSETAVIDFPEWDKNRIIKTRDGAAMKAYLTRDRLEALHALMTMNSAAAMYLFDETNGAVRIETTDPLRDAAKMEKIIAKITGLAGRLKLSPAERAALKAAG